jgi:uncharacterized protein
MKGRMKLMLLGLMLLNSCKETATEKSTGTNAPRLEDCSIVLSGISFTKSINDAQRLAIVSGDSLVFQVGPKTDNFNDPGVNPVTTAPVLLTHLDNRKPFTFVGKVTPTFKETYDAGAMYIYSDAMLWFKFAFERDERKKTRIVTVKTEKTSDDNNHDVIAGGSVYLKISSDTKLVGFYYSIDQRDWQLVRLFRNDYPHDLWLGLSAQSPVGNGASATFKECSLAETSVKDFRMGE